MGSINQHYFSDNTLNTTILKFVMLFLCMPLSALGDSKVIHIYQDADLTNYQESSISIQQGIEVAFEDMGQELDGLKIVYKYLDHRGNVIRSKQNYQHFIDDPNALAIYSGIHSPPLIKNREFINQNQALTLVPWAAGGSITRYPSKENWIFRLSIDDTQAASVIIDFALNEQGCEQPHLLLESTPWGDSNLQSMTEVLANNNINDARVSRFNWGLGRTGAKKLLNEVESFGSDCVILVGNTNEGAEIAKQMLDLPLESRLPIISHWGITGGNFHQLVTPTDRSQLDLYFIQTCFAFTNPEQSQLAKNVFGQLKKYSNGGISHHGDLKSAAGFIHAYDLTKILIQALKQTELTGDIAVDRNAVRLALENINVPVEGLVKNYSSPFSEFDLTNNFYAHEALNKSDYCIGKFNADDEIILVDTQ